MIKLIIALTRYTSVVMSAALVYKQIGLDKLELLHPLYRSSTSRKKAKENINKRALQKTEMLDEAVGQIYFDTATNEKPAWESQVSVLANKNTGNVSRDSSLNSGKISEQNQASENSHNSLNSLSCIDLLSCSTSTIDHSEDSQNCKSEKNKEVTPAESVADTTGENSKRVHHKSCKQKRKRNKDTEVEKKQNERGFSSKEQKVTKKKRKYSNCVLIVEGDFSPKMWGSKVNIDGNVEARELFESVIHPVTSDQFFR